MTHDSKSNVTGAAYVVPEAVFIVLTCLVFMVLCLIVILNRVCGCCSWLKENYYHKFLQCVFRVLEPGRDGSHPETLLHGYVVRPWNITILTLCALLVLELAVVVFLDIAIVEPTRFCGAMVDCFNTSEQSILYAKHINCNDIVSGEHFVCFRYTLDFATAAGVAGGLLALSSFLLTAITFVLFVLYEKGKCCVIVTYVFVASSLLLTVLIFAFYLWFLPWRFQIEIAFVGTVGKVAQFLLVWFVALLALVLMPLNRIDCARQCNQELLEPQACQLEESYKRIN